MRNQSAFNTMTTEHVTVTYIDTVRGGRHLYLTSSTLRTLGPRQWLTVPRRRGWRNWWTTRLWTHILAMIVITRTTIWKGGITKSTRSPKKSPNIFELVGRLKREQSDGHWPGTKTKIPEHRCQDKLFERRVDQAERHRHGVLRAQWRTIPFDNCENKIDCCWIIKKTCSWTRIN